MPKKKKLHALQTIHYIALVETVLSEEEQTAIWEYVVNEATFYTDKYPKPWMTDQGFWFLEKGWVEDEKHPEDIKEILLRLWTEYKPSFGSRDMLIELDGDC